MEVWEFDVALSTHDDLRAGVTVRHWTRVLVAALNFHEARLVATQLAACGGWMPTDALLRV